MSLNIDRNTVTVVKFSAPWCGPCKAMAPTFDEVQQTYPQAKFVDVDIDKNESVAYQYKIRSVPTTMVFVGGEIFNTTTGLLSRSQLEELIGEALQEQTT